MQLAFFLGNAKRKPKAERRVTREESDDFIADMMAMFGEGGTIT